MNEILEALKAKFEGVSEPVLKVTAHSMSKKKQTAADVENVTLDQVTVAYGDYRATEAAKPKPEVKPAAAGGTETKPGSDETPEWVKTLIASNQALTERLNKVEAGKIVETRKSQLETLIATLPEKLQPSYRRTDVEKLTDEEFTNLHGELKTEIEGIVADSKAGGVSFGKQPPAPGGGEPVKEASPEEVNSIINNWK